MPRENIDGVVNRKMQSILAGEAGLVEELGIMANSGVGVPIETLVEIDVKEEDIVTIKQLILDHMAARTRRDVVGTKKCCRDMEVLLDTYF
jgi:hypothetical protein